MDRLVADGELRAWAPRAFHEFARTQPLFALGTRGFPWIEIDFPEDYRRAVNDVLPQIESTLDAESASGERPSHSLSAAHAR
jgi:NDP-sugar pyrophosphorylase family protein